MRVQLESHPGPRGDKTCDESFWGAPALHVGSAEKSAAAPSGPPIELGVLRCGGADYAVSVRPGELGLLDATVTFRGPEELSFTGFPVKAAGHDLSGSASWVRPIAIEREDDTTGRLRFNHRFKAFRDEFNLVGELWMGQAGLQARFRLDPGPATGPWRAVFVEDASTGPWSRLAKAVYAGQGNVLIDPGAFTLGFDGHRLATSFVGFDFGGISLVQAVDGVPDRLDVDPEAKRYTLHTAHGPTFTFIPCPNVWEGAKAWRGMNGLKAAPGVPALAGRFVFDLWGGHYGESAKALERAFRYGLTDSVVIWHNWQRWGYDYRLPDILPPNPRLGTEDEFRALAELCRRHGVLFAPHDNYIDYYPDAEGYTYTKTAFDSARRPISAWFNPGRKAQAYRWRPDAVHPVIARNIDLLRATAAPTAYFIDVWSSAAPHDYWTHDGRFYDRLFTRNVWGREFAWIRERLGGAPQISESGHDALIGWLDGAQSNHLRVWRPGEPDPGGLAWKFPCADAERVPWLDAAHHDRFVLHGAGYGNRYAAGLDQSLHGIYSDDYISTEVLTAHPAMVSEPFGRDVVRKYWLLHDLMRALALQPFESHEFGPDIRRQHVTWEDGETWVNRGADDWEAAGRQLPPYGFYARAPQERPVVEAAVERRGDRVVEWAVSPVAVYGNARPAPAPKTTVAVGDPPLVSRGGRSFSLQLVWTAPNPLPEGTRPFVHFMRGDAIAFQADYVPPVPASRWSGTVSHTVAFTGPAEVTEDETFEVRAGLYTPHNAARLPLDGPDDGRRAIRLGTVRFTGADGSDFEWTPAPDDPARARLNPPVEGLVDFGALKTDGACRLTARADGVYLMPLPESRPFTAAVEWEALPWPFEAPRAVEVLDESGAQVGEAPLDYRDGVVTVSCDGEAFAYRIVADMKRDVAF